MWWTGWFKITYVKLCVLKSYKLVDFNRDIHKNKRWTFFGHGVGCLKHEAIDGASCRHRSRRYRPVHVGLSLALNRV